MTKILGVNISHHVSFAFIENNKVKEYYEEDRFNKIKGFGNDDLNYKYQALKKFKNITFDCVAISSFGRYGSISDFEIYQGLLKQVKHKTHYFNWQRHHIYHAVCGYYFSPFKDAIVIVRDGGGEQIKHSFQAIDSIHYINNKKLKTFWRLFSNRRLNLLDNVMNLKKREKYFNYKEADCYLTNQSVGGYYYLEAKDAAGFGENEEGQLMGLAAYSNKPIKEELKKAVEIGRDAQEKTLKECIELIVKAKEYSSCKNIILTGGYHLNCSNNFKLVKIFPELNFFVDPIPYDGGTAIGAALYYENY
jgi:carbamoyltransferase